MNLGVGRHSARWLLISSVALAMAVLACSSAYSVPVTIGISLPAPGGAYDCDGAGNQFPHADANAPRAIPSLPDLCIVGGAGAVRNALPGTPASWDFAAPPGSGLLHAGTVVSNLYFADLGTPYKADLTITGGAQLAMNSHLWAFASYNDPPPFVANQPAPNGGLGGIGLTGATEFDLHPFVMGTYYPLGLEPPVGAPDTVDAFFDVCFASYALHYDRTRPVTAVTDLRWNFTTLTNGCAGFGSTNMSVDDGFKFNVGATVALPTLPFPQYLGNIDALFFDVVVRPRGADGGGVAGAPVAVFGPLAPPIPPEVVPVAVPEPLTSLLVLAGLGALLSLKQRGNRAFPRSRSRSA